MKTKIKVTLAMLVLALMPLLNGCATTSKPTATPAYKAAETFNLLMIPISAAK